MSMEFSGHKKYPNSIRIQPKFDASETPLEIFDDAGTSKFSVTATGNMTVAGSQTFTGAATFNSDVTVGDNVEADALILNARLTTGSEAGAALTLDDGFTYGECNELRYTVTDWTGIGGTLRGLYLRVQSNTDSASAELRGGEVLAVPNASAVGTATGWFSQAYVKGDTAETITNLRGVHGEVSFDASRANSITLTSASPFFGKILSGKVADYTKFHGVQLEFGDMDGGSRKFGTGGLRLLEGAESGTCSLTNIVYTDMAADYFLEVTGDDIGAVNSTIAGQTVGTINAVIKCKFGSTDFFLYGYATAPSA